MYILLFNISLSYFCVCDIYNINNVLHNVYITCNHVDHDKIRPVIYASFAHVTFYLISLLTHRPYLSLHVYLV